ncbi:extracellular solute-binding protein [Phytohabitans aurantiacus]|jgi:putative spermidine/putrescine transport system substrate-binding protein|uniref:ABC transporter substrate-binding protein n=1 Tax=Phytohabitans aurantiacus TaxID=3016789 RepID=A0ABQ5R0I4_9ACTN|nr:extracellular solute-binding protein [Phytohabitans aurantiacus]GLH99366.1 ABC transporter substrate-binding protein [Phytohabitans aurantiacus]
MKPSRLALVAAALTAALVSAAACAPPEPTAPASAPPGAPELPTSPVELRILDVSGVLVLTKPLIENFAKANPKLVSKVTYESGTSADVVGKLYAQQQSGNLTTDLVLTGTEGLSLLSKQKTVLPLVPNYAGALPDLDAQMTPGALKLQKALGGNGVIISGQADGPVLAYNTKTVTDPPRTPQQLLDWAKAHPGRFGYAAVPTGSGPANQLVDALPYLLGDANPTDPGSWTKTWAYLEELNKYTAPYANKTVDTFDALAKGSLDIAVSETGWDVQMKQKGTLSDQFAMRAFDKPHTIMVAQWAAVPNGIDPGRLAVVLALVKHMLQPEQQALTIPFRAAFPIKGVDLTMAPAEAQDQYRRFGSPEFNAALIAEATPQNPVVGDHVELKYDTWNDRIGSKK